MKLNFSKILVFVCLIVVQLFVISNLVVAADSTSDIGGYSLVNCGRSDQTNECDIPQLIGQIVRIINFLLSIAWLVCLLFILWGAWGMINAGGNQEMITAAKSTLSHAIIGFLLIMVAYLLINFIVSALTTGKFDTGATLQGIFDFVKP